YIMTTVIHYDDSGAIRFPRRIVNFTDKTRYLFHIQKGIVGPSSRNKPFEVNRKIAAEKLRVPFEQMIFVGDGYTDIPCFSLIRRSGGVAFGVWDPKHRDKRSRAWGLIQEGRASNLNQARSDEHAARYQWLDAPVQSQPGRRAWGFIQEGRVSNLNQARYDEQAELYQWLEEAVESLAGRIALNNRIYRG